jgi:hypothetical protein
MKILLQIKAWQLFLVWVILSIFSLVSYVAEFLLILVYVFWIYSIGVTMHSHLPQNIRPGLGYFKFCCLFILIANLAISVFNRYYGIEKLSQWGEYTVILCFLCFAVYAVMFAARMLESVVKGELVNRSDSFVTFLYLSFTPFGFWYIQKAVKSVLKNQTTEVR